MPFCGKNENLPAINSLVTLFEAAVLSCPNKTALIDADTDDTVTFLELSERSNQLARFLIKEIEKSSRKGATKNSDGDRIVVICVPPSLDLIVALFALLKINCTYLPVDSDFPSSRVSHIINDAKPILVLTKGTPPATSHLENDELLKVIKLEAIHNQVLLEDAGTLSEEESNRFSSNELLTAILYTSGSTGVPKGVRLPQKATLNRLIWQWRHFPYAAGEVGSFKTALTFVDSISEIFGPLMTGHPVVIIPKAMTTDVESLIKVLECNNVGRIVLVPSLLRAILLFSSRQKESLLECVKLWVCSGEVFPSDLLKLFFNIFIKGQTICNFYGSTEVLGDVTAVLFKNLEDVKEKLFDNKVPIGLPVSNCQIYLLNSSLEKEVEEGKIGEIFVSGANLTHGYVGKAQPEKFLTNPLNTSENDILYRTGDFGQFINGQLHYVGRTDSQMKIRGHRIEINEVELAFQSVDGVDKFHILCFKPGEVDQALLGFFTSNSMNVEELHIKLSSLLPRYMIPQCIQIEEIPLLVNGKVDRQTLLQLHEKKLVESRRNQEFDITLCEEDQKDVALSLLTAVANVLGPVAPAILSLEQNFFEIGGNSLNSILTITTLQDAGIYIGINDFLKAENFSKMLLKLRKVTMVDSAEEIIECQLENKKYKCLPLTASMKDHIIRMTAKSFSEKGDLETYLKVPFEDFEFTMKHMWDDLLEQNLSYAVCHETTEEIVAASINDDLRRAPPLHFNSEKCEDVFNFLGFCEDAVSEQMPDYVGHVLHSEMMVTADDIPPSENVTLIKLMEQENIDLAKRRGLSAIFTTNTSALTSHICEDLFGYQPLITMQANRYIDENGRKPFKDAPDELIAVTSVYYMKNQNVDV